MQDVHETHDAQDDEVYDESDSKVDALAAVVLIFVFVAVCLHWISGQ